METAYNDSPIMKSLTDWCKPYFESYTNPTAKSLTMIFLAIFALGGVHSVRYMYNHFLKYIGPNVLSSYYYTCCYAKTMITSFMEVTARLALSVVPPQLSKLPVILIIDDTLISKAGRHFDGACRLFDHTSRNGTCWMFGHCFVCLILCIPVLKDGVLHYIRVPLAYAMWQSGEKTKLEIADELIKRVLPILTAVTRVIIMADSWYPKGVFLSSFEAGKVDYICAVRIDTVMQEVYVPDPNAKPKRGRPRKYGETLHAREIAFLPGAHTLPDGKLAMALNVYTKLFKGIPVTTFVTMAAEGTRSLFLSTISGPKLKELFAGIQIPFQEKTDFLPLEIYHLRWNIETFFYEQKILAWQTGKYKLRREQGISLLLNLSAMAYSATVLLPYLDEAFASCRDLSAQETLFQVGEAMKQQLNILRFQKELPESNKSPRILELLQQLVVSIPIAA